MVRAKSDLRWNYSAFQIDELHRHNQSLVGTLHATSLLWSTNIKTPLSWLYTNYNFSPNPWSDF